MLAVCVLVVPLEVEDGLGIGPAFLGVKGLDRLHDPDLDIAAGDGVLGRVGGLVLPLDPPAAVALASFLFHGGCCGQEEALRLDLRGVDAGALPEAVGLVVEDVLAHEPVEVLEGLADLGRVGGADGRVGADGEEALDLALVHLVEEVHQGSRRRRRRSWGARSSRSRFPSSPCRGTWP